MDQNNIIQLLLVCSRECIKQLFNNVSKPGPLTNLYKSLIGTIILMGWSLDVMHIFYILTSQCLKNVRIHSEKL